MKSRLAVSVIFILIASTFTPDAAAAFRKLRSWTVSVVDCCAAQASTHMYSHHSALTSKKQGSGEGEIMLIQVDAGRVPLNQNCAAGRFVSTAAGQIREVLDLMRLR
jgi:hypothetical protein